MTRAIPEETPPRCPSLNGRATERGVTYGYISKRRASIGRTEHSGHDVERSCARYLRVPPVLVRLWAGRIRTEHLLWSGKSAEKAVEDDFAMMASDSMTLRLSREDL